MKIEVITLQDLINHEGDIESLIENAIKDAGSKPEPVAIPREEMEAIELSFIANFLESKGFKVVKENTDLPFIGSCIDPKGFELIEKANHINKGSDLDIDKVLSSAGIAEKDKYSYAKVIEYLKREKQLNNLILNNNDLINMSLIAYEDACAIAIDYYKKIKHTIEIYTKGYVRKEECINAINDAIKNITYYNSVVNAAGKNLRNAAKEFFK